MNARKEVVNEISPQCTNAPESAKVINKGDVVKDLELCFHGKILDIEAHQRRGTRAPGNTLQNFPLVRVVPRLMSDLDSRPAYTPAPMLLAEADIQNVYAELGSISDLYAEVQQEIEARTPLGRLSTRSRNVGKPCARERSARSLGKEIHP